MPNIRLETIDDSLFYEFDASEYFIYPTGGSYTMPSTVFLGMSAKELQGSNNPIILSSLFVLKYGLRIEYFCPTDRENCQIYLYSGAKTINNSLTVVRVVFWGLAFILVNALLIKFYYLRKETIANDEVMKKFVKTMEKQRLDTVD